jgi:hypothetical protein
MDFKTLAQQTLQLISGNDKCINFTNKIQKILDLMKACQDDGFLVLKKLSDFLNKFGDLTNSEISSCKFFAYLVEFLLEEKHGALRQKQFLQFFSKNSEGFIPLQKLIKTISD